MQLFNDDGPNYSSLLSQRQESVVKIRQNRASVDANRTAHVVFSLLNERRSKTKDLLAVTCLTLMDDHLLLKLEAEDYGRLVRMTGVECRQHGEGCRAAIGKCGSAAQQRHRQRPCAAAGGGGGNGAVS
mmetsp:Transcript_24776/g.71504  ORF Transcript_24776/g.71504 Transcript_24776/m.71504 type:complete len:129 (+) Transcript_24776:277-663(+)